MSWQIINFHAFKFFIIINLSCMCKTGFHFLFEVLSGELVFFKFALLFVMIQARFFTGHFDDSILKSRKVSGWNGKRGGGDG